MVVRIMGSAFFDYSTSASKALRTESPVKSESVVVDSGSVSREIISSAGYLRYPPVVA